MLRIRIQMNSAVGEIFAFKTCCGPKIFDANLEILITNRGAQPVVVESFFDLEGEGGTERIATLMPQGEQRIAPGEVKAFYCFLDQGRWGRAEALVLYDGEGHAYRAPKVSNDNAELA